MNRPQPNEAAAYYFRYIDLIETGDITATLRRQLDDTIRFLQTIGEERSLHRYEPGKWSIRELMSHVTDTERVFAHRALWFARGFESPLPSFDQDIAVPHARADAYSWASHIEDLRAVRSATITLFGNMPEEAWARTGVASGNPVSVLALAYIIAGHLAHHRAVLEERYL
jgi:hypothetical protein